MDSWFLGPTQYSPDRWAICLRDRSRQLTATPHRGRAIGAVLAISPNAAIAREAIRLIELDDIAPASDFFVMQIETLSPAKRVILSREYSDTRSLAARISSGDIASASGELKAMLALHDAVATRVDAIWEEGSLQIPPASATESLLTEQYASRTLRMIRTCLAQVQKAIDLAQAADECETRITKDSEDETDYINRLNESSELHQLTTHLLEHSDRVSGMLREIAHRLIAAGVTTAINPGGRDLCIHAGSGPMPHIDRARAALASASNDLLLHSLSGTTVHDIASAATPSASPIASIPTRQPVVRLEPPNYLHVSGHRFVCALAKNRATVLKALIASDGSISVAAFGKKGAYCLWPTLTYPDGDSKEASSRRKALERSLSTTLSRLNNDLRNLRLPRSLTAHLVKGTVILEIA